MENKVCLGWEIYKMLSDKVIDVGTVIRDNKANEYVVCETTTNTLALKTKFSGCETGNSILCDPKSKFYKARDKNK